MAWCGGLALTTDRSMILATRIIQRGLDEQRPITEALLWQIFVGSIVFGIPEFRVA